MGLFKKSSYSSFDDKPAERNTIEKTEIRVTEKTLVIEKNLPNPNPRNWIEIMSRQIGNDLVLKLLYPDCTNYEGEKILLFENCTMADLVKQGAIDPHFSKNKKFHSPIARFEPTERGWKMAVLLCKKLHTL